MIVNDQKKNLVIIFPVYNESAGIETFVNQLSAASSELTNDLNVVLLAIENGSSDNSMELLIKLKEFHTNLNIIKLTRNFGYEVAFECGLREYEADLYCLIDSDGEDPVDLIQDYFQAIRQGFKIAYGVRKSRNESRITVLLRQFFYRFLKLIADDPFRVDVGEFSMFTRQVRDEIIRDINSYPFWRSSISRSGFNSKPFPHNRNPRISGKSKFRTMNMLSFAFIGILSTTTWPLRASIFVNFFTLLTGLLLICASYIFSFFINFQVLNYIILSNLSISVVTIAMYVARTYKNGRNRPNYYIDEKFLS